MKYLFLNGLSTFLFIFLISLCVYIFQYKKLFINNYEERVCSINIMNFLVHLKERLKYFSKLFKKTNT